MALLRNVTRTILNATETTAKTHTLNSDTLIFEMTTSDFFYVAFQGRFGARHFNFSTANTNPSALTVEQWNADTSTWDAVEDLVDETIGFTKTGFVHWVNNDVWSLRTQAPIDDLELFYVRISVSADLSVGTLLQSVINLFSDDEGLREYWPELVTDTRFLPTGRTDFLEQHKAGKDLVVRRMRQRRLIRQESQVIDINQVMLAAVHATAWIILNPIARTDEMVLLADRADKAFKNEINELAQNVDKNEDGQISESERRDLGEPTVLRR